MITLIRSFWRSGAAVFSLTACIALSPAFVRAEVMVQYFNTSYEELTRKMPELAEAGYSSMWLPPPTKGSGGLSVGYDLWDRFDLGQKDQRNSVRTRYGTMDELLRLIETAHRFGIRVYFDNIMNHNAFDIPGFNEDTALDIYPGYVPEDFHLRVTNEGFYRKWDNTRDWGSTWQVQNLGLADLIDIAHENPNTNFGPNEGDDHPKITFVRQPDNPEYYLDLDLPIPVSNAGGSFNVFTFANKEPFDDVGIDGTANTGDTGEGDGRFSFTDTNGNGQHDAGEASEPFQDLGLFPENPDRHTATYGHSDGRYNMGDPVAEDVNGIVIRAARWKLDVTNADGFRLDAVKHVPSYFFGQQSGADKDRSSAGYLGQSQEQYNITRGFSDWDNHRDSVFSLDAARDDAMMFGEHLGEPPGFGEYVDSGMRLVDNDLRSFFNGALGSPWAGLNGMDQPGSGGFSPGVAVMHAQSHDNDFAARRELQHAFYFTREGLGLVYTDGNYHAETLGESGGAFPRHANTNFLGQFGDGRLPNLAYISEHFGRGYQSGRWSDDDFVAYERIDKRERGDMSDADGVVMLIMLNDNFASGQARSFSTSFPAVSGGANAYLYQYARGGESQVPFFVWASDLSSVVVPPGGYFVFSWKSPDPASNWPGRGLEILQDGVAVGTFPVERADGPDGDPGFNPYGLPDDDPTDFTYTIEVPRVTDGTRLKFRAHYDGSAENVLFKLDAGMDLNGLNHALGDPRDNPPAVSSDVFLGYEQGTFVKRTRAEKFAAIDTLRNKIGSQGAGTYTTAIGSDTFTYDVSADHPDNDFGTDGGNVASFLYHDPEADVGGAQPGGTTRQYVENADTISIWGKTNSVGSGYNMVVYYTTDGTFPEGAGGFGTGTTQTASLGFSHNDNGGTTDWWGVADIPKPADATTFTYKIGVYRDNDGSNPVGSVFPSGPSEVGAINGMMTAFETDTIDATSITYRPHADYGRQLTGFKEGMHVIRARGFLKRSGDSGAFSSIYNTIVQPFYYDTRVPQGEIAFPQPSDTMGGSSYGIVVRVDPTVEEVWYHIADGDTSNDDLNTGIIAGNGAGFEPFTDVNNNQTWDAGEDYEDLNENGVWDGNLAVNWAQATRVTPNLFVDSQYEREYRFDYINIPASGNATVTVILREISSAGFKDFGLTAQDATDGHFALLTTTNNVDGPDRRMFVRFPASDGELVDDTYVMKVHFSKDMADGFTGQELLDQFSIRIGSTEDSDAGIVQDTSSMTVNTNVTDSFHELAWQLPNLFNGNPDYLHKITVTHNVEGLPELVANRIVKAAPSAKPTVTFISPPIEDEVGRAFEIVFPDKPSPSVGERTFNVQVRTDTRVIDVDVSLDFGPSAATTITPVRVNPPTPAEDFTDTNNNTVWDPAEPFTDDNENNSWDEGEAFTDTNNNTVWDDAEPFVDANNNGTWDAAEPDLETPVYFTEEGSARFWDFTWQFPTDENVPGVYGLRAGAHIDNDNIVDNFDVRTVPVIYRQIVPLGTDFDSDDDGIFDTDETQVTELPETNPETWTNGEVHVAIIAYGRTIPSRPDSDGDLLPDGLEVGWRVPIDSNTDTATDTDGDGFPNFIADLDPPFYNVLENEGSVPDIDSAARGGDRTRLAAGSVTEPLNPDTDGDGIIDGIEDMNRNGWVDGDGEILPTDFNPWLGRDWPDGVRNPGEVWTETDPNNPDTDDDALSDGNGEDINGNGVIDGDTNGDRTWQVGEAWTETDPLNADTDGDSLPDGWEKSNGLDPLDDGTNSLRTSVDGGGLAENGSGADPDNDTFDNATELANGTHPLIADTGASPPAGRIFIGPFPDADQITVGGIINTRAFTDWTIDDLLVLDENEDDGPNNRGGDTYLGYDGFDTSRDIVAFYFRDGGAIAQGGNDTLNFRLDFFDLQPFAEQANLDIYVVVDTGNTAVGEYALPDEVDTGTEMGWEAVVAVYAGNNGAVYVDTNVGSNTTAIGQDLTGFGVVRRDQTAANGFKQAYFNSDLDAVEFSISRQALIDAGWNGLNPDALNFQVYVTRDGTQNSPQGAGDIGGRSDIRDTIFDDFIAEDFWRDQPNIAGANSVLTTWFSRGGSNDRGKRAKVAAVIHGNQSIKPGNEIQALINDGEGAGYFRPFDVHEAYSEAAFHSDPLAPFSLHVTATLASAIQWAAVDPSASKPWLDGPAFNDRIGTLAGSGVIDLVGTTWSDHALPYFPDSYHTDNTTRASQLLTGVLGATPSADILWPTERVLNGDTLAQLDRIGYDATFVDQFRHLWRWFSRESALSESGYRINRINGTDVFAINNRVNLFVLSESDQQGPEHAFRKLLGRRARSGTQDQVIVFFANWEDFAANTSADAYDSNIAWLASRPWVRLVTPQQILDGEIDLSQPADGTGDAWGVVDRGTGLSLPTVAQLWVDHATNENYDNWYFGLAGSPAYEGLEPEAFDLRPGVPLGTKFGQIGQDGLVNDAWNALQSINIANASLREIAFSTLHASVFQTAFHNSSNNDLRQFSTGEFISPVSGSEDLSPFTRQAQSQARFAALFQRVDSWAGAAANGDFLDSAARAREDVDLDGEDEYLLYNDRLFAVFERIGGRMTATFLRDLETDEVFQVVGNFISFPGSETEEESATHRTSGFKDWFAAKADPVQDTGDQVNALYTVFDPPAGTGWTFQDGTTHISKSITLAPRATQFEASYNLNPVVETLFIRFGLSPNLADLLVNGQENLSAFEQVGQTVNLHNQAIGKAVRAFIELGPNVAWNQTPGDEANAFDTINQRNQAQVQQVEISSGESTFTFALGFETGSTNNLDRNGDGLPDAWVETTGLATNGQSGPNDNPDGDDLTNEQEFIAGTNPLVSDVFTGNLSSDQSGFTISFDTLFDRTYRVWYTDALGTDPWQQASGDIIGNGNTRTWTDDGSETGTSPMSVGMRFYQVRASILTQPNL